MAGMESSGAVYSPRATKTQAAMQPQAKFNMPSIGSRMSPASAAPTMASNSVGQRLRPPTTQQPGMGLGPAAARFGMMA